MDAKVTPASTPPCLRGELLALKADGEDGLEGLARAGRQRAGRGLDARIHEYASLHVPTVEGPMILTVLRWQQS